MELDWKVILESISIAGICFAIIYYGFKALVLFITQWKNSTDAVNKNTEAFTNLTGFFEKSHERELQFQKEALELMKETNNKVRDIHSKIV